MKKDMKRLVREVEALGYTVIPSGGGHLKVKNASGGTVATMPCSPTCPRSYQNTRRDLRRAGVLA